VMNTKSEIAIAGFEDAREDTGRILQAAFETAERTV